MALALPKLRWLVIGAIAAGVWVVREDMKGPRPPERVPPAKPQKIVTGSVTRPDKPTFVQTKAKVFVRAQARPDAPIVATLGPRTVLRELARSGHWRLVMGDGRKGWVRADYLAKPTFLPRRPKLPVATIKQAKTAAAKNR